MSRTREDLFKTRHIDVLIGRRLREIREAMGLTQEQVGTDLGVSARNVGNVESGDRIPASRLWQFCGRYGVEVQAVFAGFPHDVGPPVAEEKPAPASGDPTREFGDDADPTFGPMPNDPLVVAIAEAASGLTALERAMALAAVRGIGSKSLRKV